MGRTFFYVPVVTTSETKIIVVRWIFVCGGFARFVYAAFIYVI